MEQKGKTNGRYPKVDYKGGVYMKPTIFDSVRF